MFCKIANIWNKFFEYLHVDWRLSINRYRTPIVSSLFIVSRRRDTLLFVHLRSLRRISFLNQIRPTAGLASFFRFLLLRYSRRVNIDRSEKQKEKERGKERSCKLWQSWEIKENRIEYISSSFWDQLLWDIVRAESKNIMWLNCIISDQLLRGCFEGDLSRWRKR